MLDGLNIRKHPIYLHFLDRELRRAEAVEFSDVEINCFLKIAIVLSTEYCYCGVSIVWESSLLFPKTTKLLYESEKSGVVRFSTNEHTIDEFIESRQILYSGNTERYPMYFKDIPTELWPKQPLTLSTSTTQILKTEIYSWLTSDGKSGIINKDKYSKILLKRVEKKIKDKQRAITIDLFKKAEDTVATQRSIARLISYFFTKRYLDVCNGDILSKLPGISAYDSLCKSPYLYNYELARSLLKQIGFFNLQDELFVEVLSSSAFKFFQHELILTINSLSILSENNLESDYLKCIALLKRSSPYNSAANNIEMLYGNLKSLIGNLYNQSSGFKLLHREYLKTNSMNKKILIVVATDIEREVIITTFEKEHSISHTEEGNLVIWKLGLIKNLEVLMVKTDMGSVGPSGSILTINEAADAVNPDFIVMVGICFGLNEADYAIGDILISKQLQNYELVRQGSNGVTPRGDKIPCSAHLLTRFDSASVEWKKVKVKPGFMISGEKLSDDKEFVDYLKSTFKEAIGADMEGSGLLAVGHRKKIDWILIKGICDWGYDKDKLNQKLAISNVAEFLLYTLNNFGF